MGIAKFGKVKKTSDSKNVVEFLKSRTEATTNEVAVHLTVKNKFPVNTVYTRELLLGMVEEGIINSRIMGGQWMFFLSKDKTTSQEQKMHIRGETNA